MARKRKTRKRHKKAGAYPGNNSLSNTPAAATNEEKINQERYVHSRASGPVRHIVEFSQGKYFNKNVGEGQELPESQQPCLICHNTEGPLINKGETQLNVRIRKCSTCKSLFHRRCLARYFYVKACDGFQPNCPVCKKIWPYGDDIDFLLLEEEERRETQQTQQPQPIEEQFQDIEIPVPGTNSLASRFCRFTSRRLENLRRGAFFGTRRRRNNAIVPMGGEGKRKTKKRKNKRKRTRRVKRKRRRRRKKSKKVR